MENAKYGSKHDQRDEAGQDLIHPRVVQDVLGPGPEIWSLIERRRTERHGGSGVRLFGFHFAGEFVTRLSDTENLSGECPSLSWQNTGVH
jgi:hypothetical protein